MEDFESRRLRPRKQRLNYQQFEQSEDDIDPPYSAPLGSPPSISPVYHQTVQAQYLHHPFYQAPPVSFPPSVATRSVSDQTIIEKEDEYLDEEPDDDQDDKGSVYAPSARSSHSATPLEPAFPYAFPPAPVMYQQPVPSRKQPSYHEPASPEDRDVDYFEGQANASTGPVRGKRGKAKNKDPSELEVLEEAQLDAVSQIVSSGLPMPLSCFAR